MAFDIYMFMQGLVQEILKIIILWGTVQWDLTLVFVLD